MVFQPEKKKEKSSPHTVSLSTLLLLLNPCQCLGDVINYVQSPSYSPLGKTSHVNYTQCTQHFGILQQGVWKTKIAKSSE